MCSYLCDISQILKRCTLFVVGLIHESARENNRLTAILPYVRLELGGAGGNIFEGKKIPKKSIILSSF